MSFKQGNIVRVVIKNFLTFDDVTVTPKPYLNLIIGPNGTGKSTILCAICICLGGKPEVTGRSKSIDNFVKHGKSYATVEVELYNENGSNQVIRREFGPKVRRYYMQGKTKTQKEVEEVVRDFSIQIDNLCTFLPQDRVANFAKMNNIQLLEATEKAVGDPSLSEYHELLCNSGGKMKEIKIKIEEISNEIETLQSQNARLKDVVENVHQKEKIEEEIEQLQRQKLYHLYERKRLAVREVTNRFRQLIKIRKDESDSIKPFKDQIDQSKGAIKTKHKSLHEKIMKFQKANQRSNDLAHLMDDYCDSVRNVAADFEAKKVASEQRLREIEDYQKQLDVFNAKLESLPAFNEAEFEMKMQKLTQDINKTANKSSRVSSEIDELMNERREIFRKKKSCESSLSASKDVMEQRMELLKRKNSHAYNAARWLRDNGGIFKHSYYMPICTLLNIKDPTFVNVVESTISQSDLVAFVFEDKDEMNLFKTKMDKEKLRVNIVHSTPMDVTSFRPAHPINAIRKYGFEFYMSDLIDAPPAVLAYLHKNNRIHQIPIARREDIVSTNLPLAISLFFMGSLKVSCSRSRYDNELTTESSKVREGDLLKITINHERIRALEQEIMNCDEKVSEGEDRIKVLKEEEQEMKADLERWRNEKQGYMSRKQERNQLQSKINAKVKQIKLKSSETFNEKEEEQKMQDKIQNTIKSMTNSASEIGQFLENNGMCSAQECYKLKGAMKIQKVYADCIAERISQKEEQIRKMEIDLKKMEEEKNAMTGDAKSVLVRLQASFNVRNPGDIPTELIEKFRKNTEEEVQHKLIELEARRECIHTADEMEIRNYREREVSIVRLKKSLEKENQRMHTQESKIEESRSRWLPCVEELVGKISSSFTNFMERLECAGQVDLIHNEEDEHDYSKYGIAIMVKFRNADKLRILTAQHQSGGERAVATALYMLSLQNLTSVPFRCVDEINQGMDPVNERKMLTMLMETAAKEDSSQYFFVSPKLLPDLEYTERVNTIVVYNGPIVLSDGRFSVKDVIKRKKMSDKSKQGITL